MDERRLGSREDERSKGALVNVGIPPEKKEGKLVCEDVKINDPQMGLFMVADGVSLADGARAARTVSEYSQRYLGKDLDDGIRNNFETEDLSPEEKLLHVDTLVKVNMVRALQEAHDLLRLSNAREATTTASLTKLVDSPNGKTRMYFANVGDSRIYVIRGGKLEKLTLDDNDIFASIGKEIVPGQIFTAEDARMIDQVKNIDDLSEVHKMIKSFTGSRINRAVGSRKNPDLGYVVQIDPANKKERQKEVQHIDLEPGDRILITSDGVHDQLLETEMEHILNSNTESSLQAETELQRVSKETSDVGKALNPRSKKDDIAAVVFQVGEIVGGKPREKLFEPKEQKEALITESNIEGYRAHTRFLFAEMRKWEKKVRDVSGHGFPHEEQLRMREFLNRTQVTWSQYDYAVKKYYYDKQLKKFNLETADESEKQVMAIAKAQKDSAEKRYFAYLTEGKKLRVELENIVGETAGGMVA